MTPTKALITDFTKFFSIQPVDDALISSMMTKIQVENIKNLQHPRYGLSICYLDKQGHYHQMMAIFDERVANFEYTALKQWFDDNSPTGKPLTNTQFLLMLDRAVKLPF